MSRDKHHDLKTLDRYWGAVLGGEKTFEVRKNDRAFQTGDELRLIKSDVYGQAIRTVDGQRQIIRKRITYLLQGGQFGIEPGYCVLGLGEPS